MTKVLARDPARRCLPLAEWPAPDRQAWEAALIPGDILDEGGARAGYSSVSNRKVARGYGRWLSWLAFTGRLEPAAAPADRITRERVAAYVGDLEAFNGTHTLLARLEELYQMALVLDRGRGWGWIRQIGARIRARHVPVRNKRKRMVGAAELFELGCRLMAEASTAGSPRQQAITYRDGLIVALLSARPLRLRNLAGLRVGSTLARRGSDWWICIPGSLTKTGEPIEEPLPAELEPALAIYLERHRPVLAALRGRWAAPVEDALWVSSNGSPMTAQALYDRIVARTAEAFGQPINPHLFRDCAATSIAIEDPAHIGMASRLLGHRNRATTERYYNQAQAIEAARRWQAFLLRLRAGMLGGAPDNGEP
jgi:integrase